MRICLIGWADYPHVQRQSQWFAGRGHDVHVMSKGFAPIEGVTVHNIEPGPDERGRMARWTALSFNTHFNRRLGALRNLRTLIRQLKPDIVHSYSWNYPGYLGAFLDFHPYVVSIWNYNDLCIPWPDMFWGPRGAPTNDHVQYRNLLERTISWKLLDRADIVTAFPSVAEELRRMRVAPMKVREHIWGADLERFVPSKNKAGLRRDLGLPADGAIVLSSRNVSQLNNTSNILRAIPQVLRRCPDTTFVFTWNYFEPEYAEKEVRPLTASLGLGDRIRMVGHVPHRDVLRYYQVADIFISIPTWDPGPISLLEAMGCGAAPVLSDLPFVADWTKGNASVVDPGNVDCIAQGLARLLSDLGLRTKIAEANRIDLQQWGDHQTNMLVMEQFYFQLARGMAAPSTER